MNIWDTYQHRIASRGNSIKGASFQNENYYVNSKLPNNLSYQEVIIDGIKQNVSIINSENYNQKTIISLPGEDLTGGSLVYWNNGYWLISERDAENTIYTRAKMLRCNYLLKWVSEDSVIHEQWCVVEDATNYLSGEYEDRNFIVTRGDTRIVLIIAKNEHTLKFNRNRRFLVDDPESDFKIAYVLSKPFKLGNVFDNKGVYRFIMQEVATTEDDNQELGIADYYKHFPKESEEEPNEIDNTQKKGWI